MDASTPSPPASSPFHAGELRAQLLAGSAASGGAIRDFMPEQHRTFFAALRFLLLATTDDSGAPVAAVISGPQGFASSPDPRSLRLAFQPDPLDPVAGLLRPGRPVGLLGIDFGTRRRNRANGMITAAQSGALTVSLQQSFGNCPKYIQSRLLEEAPAAAASETAPQVFAGLDAEAQRQIAAADTFFVASSAGTGGGVDISHRGGPAGFVRIDGNTLSIPDFRGNAYFNTFGNLLQEARAALLFIDFANGSVLQLQGRAEILWDTKGMDGFAGAERWWRLRVDGGWRRHSALPLRWQQQVAPS